MVAPWLFLAVHATTQAAQIEDRAAAIAASYARAERFLPWNAEHYVRNGNVRHRWIAGTERFWYVRDEGGARRFVIFDAAKNRLQTAFDHQTLALALAEASGQAVDAAKLPIASLDFSANQSTVIFSAFDRRWRCELKPAACAHIESPRPGDLVSPDGKLAVFVKEHDIWLRSLTDGSERPLTTEGVLHHAYGAIAGSAGGTGPLALRNRPSIPMALWSPDSRHVLTHRLDERRVLDLHLLRNVPATGVRPELYTMRYAMPGDPGQPTAEMVVLEANGDAPIAAVTEPLPVPMIGPIEDNRAWWSEDGKTAYVLPREVGQQRLRLLAIDVGIGAARMVVEESGDTYLDASGYGLRTPAIRTLSSGEVIWYSERDGWGHLYLYGPNGRLRNRITSGAWKVMQVVHVDEARRRLYFTAVGTDPQHDPYLRRLFSIGLDGSDRRLLTPEHGEHVLAVAVSPTLKRIYPQGSDALESAFSPSGRYFVGSWSRPDLPPITVVRDAQGTIISVIERADVNALAASGYSVPEPFSALAADGETRIYGTIYRPTDLDPDKRYPVIDAVYPGPQRIVTPKTFMAALFDDDGAQAQAETGFVVVQIDGRGTAFRSKEFHDLSYGQLQDAGALEDHIAALRQLAVRYPYMDVTRVGIYGHSGGGFATVRAMLAYPDFYKVGVASAGNHDQRGYLMIWGPTYQGPYSAEAYAAQINARLAHRLQGKLMLVHGEMDDNVHPALTMQVVDALIKADKDFDLLILPNEDHEYKEAAAYVIRRRWDYFVRHLLGTQPPAGYRLTRAVPSRAAPERTP